MANCLYCKHFIKLKHAEGCAKYKKVLLTWEKDCRGFEFNIEKFKSDTKKFIKGFAAGERNA